jgi:hypothetical protein
MLTRCGKRLNDLDRSSAWLEDYANDIIAKLP